MAKKKKLTLEEKLEEAIVKDAPYEVPENWVWTNICNLVSTLETGKRPKGGVSGIQKGVPSLGGEHLDYNGGFKLAKIKYIPEEFANNLKKGIIEKEDILIVKDGATTGKTSYVDEMFPFERAVINEHVFKCRIITKINSKFIFWFIKSPIGQEFIKLNLKGSAQGGINTKFIKNFPIAIPPLKEQQRIVDRIESLFEKLDKAKELIDEAREEFEKRKCSIIESALKGEFLSEVVLKEVELESILKFKNGLSKRSGKEGSVTKVLRLADIENDIIYSENSREILLTEKEIEKYKVENGDLLLIRVNGTKNKVGRAVQYFGDEICAYCDHLIRIEAEGYNKDYIKFLINSDEVRKQINELIVSSAGQNTISQSSLNIIKANVIEDLNIQVEIVNIINGFVEKESKIEELTKLEDQIELIKKSILAKAFRGELGTNCEEEESAVELLKEILNEN